MPCRAVPCRVVSCRVVSCRVVSCRVVPCRAVPCRAVPCRAVPCRDVPRRAAPRRAAPRRAATALRCTAHNDVTLLLFLCRPIAGNVNICPSGVGSDYNNINSEMGTVKHEMFHALVSMSTRCLIIHCYLRMIISDVVSIRIDKSGKIMIFCIVK